MKQASPNNNLRENDLMRVPSGNIKTNYLRMKNLISTSTGKYVVNVLMIVMFFGLAITGLFFMEGGGGHEGGGRHELRGENNQEKLVKEIEVSDQIDEMSFINFDGHKDFEGLRGGDGGGKSEGIHQFFAIFWLILMALHIWQHWSWFKKLFTRKHIKENKLLTSTLVLFVLLILTTIDPFMAIHAFIGQILVGLMIIHVIQRFKWYVAITQKLFVKKPIIA